MALLPPGVSSYCDRHGKVRYRFRRKGLPDCSLPGAPGADKFQQAYAAALSGQLRQTARRKANAAPRTLRAAWLELHRSIEWKRLKPSSKTQQIGIAERFLMRPIADGAKVTFGQMPFAGLRRGDVKKIIGRYSEHPHAGEAVLRLLRKLCLVALDLEWIENDPTFRIRFRPPLKGHRAWTDAEHLQFEQRWPVGSRERLGYALALYTGQRRADVAAMSLGAYDGEGIAVVQEKTNAPLWIPAHPELKPSIAETPRDGPWLICAAGGRRFTTESFGNFMADAISAAGLPDECRLHGLRKSAGRQLADAGCTAHQIMAILGHKTLAEAQRYTRDADQRHLAQQGIDRWLPRPKFAAVTGGK